MRRIVLGPRPDGTSYIESDEVVAAERRRTIAEWDGTPRSGPPYGTAEVLEVGVAPGTDRWVVIELPPETEVKYHRTNTVDYVFVVDGDITLVHGEGEVTAGPGDCIVLNAADHGWRTGPRPVVLSAVSHGFA